MTTPRQDKCKSCIFEGNEECKDYTGHGCNLHKSKGCDNCVYIRGSIDCDDCKNFSNWKHISFDGKVEK